MVNIWNDIFIHFALKEFLSSKDMLYIFIKVPTMNQIYAVQRSSNGVNWSTIQNEAAIHHYFNDASPLPGTNYYRLQTTSVDYAIAYSNVIAILNFIFFKKN